MKYMTDTLDFQLEKRSVVTLGKFDGLHKGHEKLLQRVLALGKEGYETVVFTPGKIGDKNHSHPSE